MNRESVFLKGIINRILDIVILITTFLMFNNFENSERLAGSEGIVTAFPAKPPNKPLLITFSLAHTSCFYQNRAATNYLLGSFPRL